MYILNGKKRFFYKWVLINHNELLTERNEFLFGK
jgi:hypothetical protein